MQTSSGLDSRHVRDKVAEQLPEYLDDLATLVNIDSGTFDKAGVDQVVRLLAGKYRDLGAQVEIVPNQELGDGMVATLDGSGSGRVLLIGHTDTVFPVGTAAERPFRVVGDRAYGPGVADMKAGDLSILYALRALRSLQFDNFARITVVHNPDEEIGSPSSRDLIRRESEAADAVLVLEPGRENGNIVSSRKGIVDLQLEVRGVAAHAGVNKHRGRSAAVELASIVIGLEELNGAVPDTTLTIGQMESGIRPNVVPDSGRARGEIRAFRMEHIEDMIARAHEVVARRTVEDTSAELSARIEHYPMDKSARSQVLVNLAQSFARELGFEARDQATGGASDGNTAARAGRPVLDALGPVGGHAHSPLEYIEVPSIVPRAALLTMLIGVIGTGVW